MDKVSGSMHARFGRHGDKIDKLWPAPARFRTTLLYLPRLLLPKIRRWNQTFLDDTLVLGAHA